MKYHIIWNKIQLVICWKRVNTNLSFVLHWPNHQQKTIVLIKRNPFSISLPIPAAAPVHLFQILSYHAVALRPPAIHLLSPCKVSLKLIFWFEYGFVPNYVLFLVRSFLSRVFQRLPLDSQFVVPVSSPEEISKIVRRVMRLCPLTKFCQC